VNKIDRFEYEQFARIENLLKEISVCEIEENISDLEEKANIIFKNLKN
jgi:hypothetical protein